MIWNSSPNVDSYDVYLDITNPPVVKVDSNRTDTSYTYVALLPGHTYYWKILAKNVNANTVASDAPHSFSTVNVPPAASNVLPANITPASLRLTWTDNAGDETGYRVYRSASAGGPFVQMGSDLPANTSSFNDSGLAINQIYYYRIAPFNGVGEGNFVAIGVATAAVTPGTPVVSNAGYTSLTAAVDPSVNPSATEFAIRARKDSVAAGFVQTDGRLGASPVWKTYAQWGAGSGEQVTGLHSCHAYLFGVLARNLDDVQTSASAEAAQTLPCYNVSQSSLGGWNLLSLPVIVSDPLRVTQFPGSASNAFFYMGSYQRKDTLSYGAGFWLKYNSVSSLNFAGEPRILDSISVTTGWNLIGALSHPIAAAAIVADPPAIVASKYFGYNGAYVAADSLMTMRGYWVKTSGAGKLILSSSQQVPASMQKRVEAGNDGDPISITIEDKEHHKQVLTLKSAGQKIPDAEELPPVPPAGAFDVRFEGQGTLMTLTVNEQQRVQRIPIAIQSGGNSLNIGVSQNALKNIFLEVEDAGVTRPLPRSGGMTLEHPPGTIYLVARYGSGSSKPATTALLQNYPNPFNPVTSIGYQLAEAGRVSLTIVDVLGQEVALLDNGEKEAGEYTVAWDAGSKPSGLYFYRLDVTSGGRNIFTQVKKLLYVK